MQSVSPKGDKSLYLLDNMLSYGKPFILDWAIPQEEGVRVPRLPGFSFGTIEWLCPGMVMLV